MFLCVCVSCRYTPDEARALKSYGELPANAKINETDAFGDEEGGGGGIDFQDSDSESGSEEEEAANDLDIDDVRSSQTNCCCCCWGSWGRFAVTRAVCFWCVAAADLNMSAR